MEDKEVKDDKDGSPSRCKMPKIMKYSEKCYMCKWRMRNPSVDQRLCNICKNENLWWKSAGCDLSDRFAVVTGARIKIGFQIALRLLRNGCFVIGTSRLVGEAELFLLLEG